MDDLRQRIDRLEFLLREPSEPHATLTLIERVLALRDAVEALPLSNVTGPHLHAVRTLESLDRVVRLSMKDSDARRDHIAKSELLRSADQSAITEAVTALQRIDMRTHSLDILPEGGIDAMEKMLLHSEAARSRRLALDALVRRVAAVEDTLEEFVGQAFEMMVLFDAEIVDMEPRE